MPSSLECNSAVLSRQPTDSHRSVAPSTTSRRRRNRSQSVRWVRRLTFLNCLALLVVWWLLFRVSESWWLSAALTYLPRLPYLLPALVLLAFAVPRDRRSAWINLAAIGFVLGPIAECQIPTFEPRDRQLASDAAPPLRIVSCNVQDFEPDFATVLQEVAVLNPDLVAFQECRSHHPLLDKFFDGWHAVHDDEYWIGSRFPLREMGRCVPTAFERTTAIKVRVEAPGAPCILVSLHLTSARHGLLELGTESVWDGTGSGLVDRSVVLRQEEARRTRQFVSEPADSVPLLVMGDFNAPSSSSLYRRHWSDLVNAFDRCGLGYGYTAPCSDHRHWPDGVPWIRVDHILASEDWSIDWCRVGHSNGSDHRLIAAEVRLRSGK